VTQLRLRPARDVAEAIDTGCDAVAGAAVVTRDRLELVGLLRVFAHRASSLGSKAILFAADELEQEIKRREYTLDESGRTGALVTATREWTRGREVLRRVGGRYYLTSLRRTRRLSAERATDWLTMNGYALPRELMCDT
jgi:hypothetical protein